MEETKEKTYNKIKTRLSIIDIVLDILLLAILAFSGLSHFFADISSITSKNYINFFIFAFYKGLFFSIF